MFSDLENWCKKLLMMISNSTIITVGSWFLPITKCYNGILIKIISVINILQSNHICNNIVIWSSLNIYIKSKLIILFYNLHIYYLYKYTCTSYTENN